MVVCNSYATNEHLSRVKGVIFDCDGVMIDSFEANRKYYNLFLKRFDLPLMTEEQEEYVHAHAVFDSLAYILPESLHHRIKEVHEDIDYREILTALELEDGLYDLLAFLKARQIRLAVNTSRTTTMDLVLDHFGLRTFFNPVITASNVANRKPHPESLFKILSTWGLSASDVAYIGDTTVDEQAAQAAGVPFWAYKNERLTADMHIQDFYELKSCILKAAATAF